MFKYIHAYTITKRQRIYLTRTPRPSSHGMHKSWWIKLVHAMYISCPFWQKEIIIMYFDNVSQVIDIDGPGGRCCFYKPQRLFKIESWRLQRFCNFESILSCRQCHRNAMQLDNRTIFEWNKSIIKKHSHHTYKMFNVPRTDAFSGYLFLAFKWNSISYNRLLETKNKLSFPFN